MTAPPPPAMFEMDSARRNRVRSILMLGGVGFSDLDDALQVVTLKVLERPEEELRSLRAPEAWLATVASRVAVDWHRSQGRTRALRDRLESSMPAAIDDRQEQRRTTALVVADALDAMNAEDRQLLTLRYFADLTVPQIAQRLGVPLGTVKSRLHHASTRLRDQLAQQGDLHD